MKSAAGREIDLPYEPTERQKLFHASTGRYTLFGGAAGPGKSEATMWEPTICCLEYPGWEALILRRTFPELEQSLIKRFLTKVPRELYEWNGTNRTATFNNGSVGVAGSSLKFGHLQHEDDVQKHKSDEFGGIHFDELTTFTFPMWTYMGTRNRTKIPGTFARMTGASNPEGLGLEWVKALWIDREPCAEMDTDQAAAYRANVSDYVFIPAKLSDNPHMAVNDPTYGARLAQLPAHLRRALLDGDWNVIAGTFFDCWNEDAHVLRRGLDGRLHTGIEPWTPRWISIDWGFTGSAASVHWHAFVAPRVVTYREQVVRHMTPEKLGDLIGSITRGPSEETREPIERVILSPDAFDQRSSDLTIAIQLAEALRAWGLPAPERADNDRVGGAVLMYQLLQGVQWLITEDCPLLIKTIPTRQRDPVHLGDILKVPGSILDDVYDDVRYGLKTRMQPPRVPYDVQIDRRVTSKDPRVAMAQYFKAIMEIQDEDQPVRLVRRQW